ncbi:uncharacterized protein NPIL_51781 [Nephila pilipes]|uniref:Uncharacterized protein n=1 Tax=Nephila pilipes TaxID=299642 RepID=A0A8X6Q4I7_NEPPI|nr:uncharacterized protein NPIL_51781 [Nephila pilipes]
MDLPSDSVWGKYYINGVMANCLSSSIIDEYYSSSNTGTKVWTLTCAASRRLNIILAFHDDSSSLTFGKATCFASCRNRILRIWHNHFKQEEMERFLALASLGKAMECVAMHSSHSHYISNGGYTRFADWSFIHRLRLNLVQLNANKHQEPIPSNKLCRCCGAREETFSHAIMHSALRKPASRQYEALAGYWGDHNIQPELVPSTTFFLNRCHHPS